jgi:glycosyltransferase involved in cell wall biosynthesis
VFNSSVVSGPETLVLPALSELGVPVSVVFLAESRLPGSAEGPIAYARSFGLDVHQVNVRGRLDLRAVRDLRALFRRIEAGIVHAHDVKASFYALLAGRGLGLVSTHHGIHGRPDVKSRLYERLYASWILKAFDEVVAVSTADYNELVARGLAPERLKLIWNGIRQDVLSPEERERRRAPIRAGWSLDDELAIGVVGRLSREKRCDRILEVARELERLDPRLAWRILFFGDGPERDLLRRLAVPLGSRVRWMGYRKGVAKEMAGLDLLLSLSDAEGQPISLLEAAYAGTPIFATRVGGIPDILPSEDFGYTVARARANADIAACLHQALVDPDRMRKAAALQARVRAEFSRERWLEAHRNLYAQLLASQVAK